MLHNKSNTKGDGFNFELTRDAGTVSLPQCFTCPTNRAISAMRKERDNRPTSLLASENSVSLASSIPYFGRRESVQGLLLERRFDAESTAMAS